MNAQFKKDYQLLPKIVHFHLYDSGVVNAGLLQEKPSAHGLEKMYDCVIYF